MKNQAKKAFLYSYSFGVRVVTAYLGLHGRALLIWQRLYGGQPPTLIYQFLTDQKWWRKFKTSITIIENNEEKDDVHLKYVLRQYFQGGYYNETNGNKNKSDNKTRPAKRRRKYGGDPTARE